MNRSSFFNIKISFKDSHGSYLVDKDSKKEYLDFFGQYSTLAIGYNHNIFKSNDFIDDINRIAHQKITNCEIKSDDSMEFDRIFRKFTSKNIFTHYHYCSTGALAIESAIKTAMDYKGSGHYRVISFKGSFHGINSYGGFLTDRFDPVRMRLEGLPGQYWPPINNPVIEYVDGKEVINENNVNESLDRIEKLVKSEKNICAILVEPIQCTYGDYYFPDIFFKGVKQISEENDIPLIFDEIQVGFGGTGKVWYFEHLPIEPDILAFGKKSQLSGIAVKENFSAIFSKAIRLEVTWDADIMDMIRCKYIISAYQKYDVFNNVKNMSIRLKNGLSKISKLQNIRNCGLLFAFDFENKSQRNCFVKEVIKNRMLCNPTRDNTVRLRPHLFVSSNEVDHALSIINSAIQKI